jgi:hypothetical protein
MYYTLRCVLRVARRTMRAACCALRVARCVPHGISVAVRVSANAFFVAYPSVRVLLQERLAQLPGGLRHPELLSVWDQWSYFQHEDKIIFVDEAERFAFPPLSSAFLRFPPLSSAFLRFPPLSVASLSLQRRLKRCMLQGAARAPSEEGGDRRPAGGDGLPSVRAFIAASAL